MDKLPEWQPTSEADDSSCDEIDKLFAGAYEPQTNSHDIAANQIDQNSDNQYYDTNNEIDILTLTNFANVDIDHDLLDIIEAYDNPSVDTQQTYRSTFIVTNEQRFQCAAPSAPSLVQVNDSPVEPKFFDTRQNTAIVGPVDYILNSHGCQPCTTVDFPQDYAYQQQILEYDVVESKKIQIKCQPREKFRPRTQNESKISAHYIRCEEGVKPNYPTISIPQAWNFQSDANIIEVALVGIDKELHPYSIDNKTSSDTYEENALIFKQHAPNILYFRLTNEDFYNEYKSFMIEMIKSKQDNVITKELIRTRKLDSSMLRFTRLFQVGKEDFQRDEGSVEYSCIMTEAYGDVEVEHMGPRFGPMNGQEMVYMVLKGRILKTDLKIEIVDELIGWNYPVQNFTKNGNVVYFLMPAYPYPQYDSHRVNIIVYYKEEEFYRTIYVYKGSLDQELAELSLNDRSTTDDTSPTDQSFNPLNFMMATGVYPTATRRTSKAKRTKRLNKTEEKKKDEK